MTQKIYIVPGFHVNYNHSWRGDRNDRTGFGLDSIVIKGILDILDEANEKGLQACGTWDFDNYWSIEHCMTGYAPELLERITRRVKAGTDEAILDAWNNGILGAATVEEFRETIKRTISNPAGSGIKDVFGSYSPIVRTQETTFTQGSIELFKEQGVEAICLYYSSIPFDAVRNFITPLTPNEMFNPLWFNSTESDERMIMIPMYSQGDVVNNGSLKNWVKKIRRLQQSGKIAGNALLYLNMDADAEIWTGLPLPGVLKKIPNAGGLHEFIDLVKELDYVEFGNLGEYIRENEPVGEVTVSQDLADGSFTGYNSWTEKEENHRLWRIGERARRFATIAEAAADTLNAPEETRAEIRGLLEEGEQSWFESKLKLISTTHFGMHAPAVHLERAQVGFNLARSAIVSARDAAVKAIAGFPAPDVPSGLSPLFSFSVIDQSAYREKTSPAPGTKAMLRIPFKLDECKLSPENVALFDAENNPVRFDFSDVKKDSMGNLNSGIIWLLHENPQSAPKHYFLAEGRIAPSDESVEVAGAGILSPEIQLSFDSRGRVNSLKFDSREFASARLVNFAASYKVGKNKKMFTPRTFKVMQKSNGPNGLLGSVTLEGNCVIFNKGVNYTMRARYTFSVFAGLPFVYLDAEAQFPETPCEGTESSMATGSERKFDTNWDEVMPFQITPGFNSLPGKYMRVWKHNYMDVTNSYEFNYKEIDPKNANIDSCNNHITDGWIAVSNSEQGLLVSNDAVVNSSPAYCPVRVRDKGGIQKINLNPFGTYYGKQFNHLHDGFNPGAFFMRLAAPQLRSVAPSYNGKSVCTSMMIAPYSGDEPPEDLREQATRFAMPPAVVVHTADGPALHIEKVITRQLAEAVSDYDLDKFVGWTYPDFLEDRNKDIPKGVPDDAGGDPTLKLLRKVISGVLDWS